MKYGHFNDAGKQYVITNPLTPRPWINYLGNRKLTAFITQNAGGLLWYLEPQMRRITRYHYLPAPPDRPGFYVYLKNRTTGSLWNPHFAPTCTPLDSFQCRHAPGTTQFVAEKENLLADVTYVIPPDDAMLFSVSLTNNSDRTTDVQAVSFVEFGLLEFMREVIAWPYLQHHTAFEYDAAISAIRYDYHVFEAAFTPRMLFGCSEKPSGFECSRNEFVGRTGSLQLPDALKPGADLAGTNLPIGGHGCGSLAVEISLAPGETKKFAYIFTIADTWQHAENLLARYKNLQQTDAAIAQARDTWNQRLNRLQANTGNAAVDRAVNIWTPYNAAVTTELARIVSTDHIGLDGLRYRDTTQDAHAGSNVDPELAALRMRQVFAQQASDGGGCFAFFPNNTLPTSDQPHRSDNTVWQIYTIQNLVAETGDFGFLEEVIPFRDSGEATIYQHILLGLKHIYDRRGPNGLPLLFHADWNDGLALFGDEQAESVLTGMQMVHACNLFEELATRLGRDADAQWCRNAADELAAVINSDLVWDGAWYRRLLLSNGKHLGGSACRQGSIYLNPQSWAVISGVGNKNKRGAKAMQSAAGKLDTQMGLCILAPPYKGIPEPEDPPLGSSPGTGENGSIFCHANTWAIIAEALLGNAQRAFDYYYKLLPEVASETVGPDLYQREPYVYVSTIVGPVNENFGKGGISWLTGTASWMYIAATHYLLGIRPTYDGLAVAPCLPKQMQRVTVRRKFRGCLYSIEIINEQRGSIELEVNGRPIDGNVVPVSTQSECRVRCKC